MIADLKPYPAIKDSGVPWLGNVPEHWELKRAKWLFRKMDRPVRDADEVVTCFRDGLVTLRRNRRVRGFTESLKEIGYQGICRGDLVIHAMDAFAGAIGVADSDGKGTPVYSVCEPLPMANSYYYAYTLREMSRNQWIQALAKGIRERSTDFRFAGFGSQMVPLPPLPEQAAIVRYLDYMDRRIRRYIRAKQKLIKLLEEQKQAIIHHAVTRGLDPNVRLKPSGMEWLGDVPEHWEVKRLKSSVNNVIQQTSKCEDNDLYIALEHVESWTGQLRHAGSEVIFDSQVKRFQSGDVLFGKLRPYLAKVTRPRSNGVCVGEFFVLRPIATKIIAPYLEKLLRSKPIIDTINSSTFGAKMPRADWQFVGGIQIPLPSHPEQIAIVHHLDKAIFNITTTIDHTHCEIALLREYRTRLIADVVTGKLDVREVAARLPDETDKAEPIDEPDELNGAEEDTVDNLDAKLEEEIA